MQLVITCKLEQELRFGSPTNPPWWPLTEHAAATGRDPCCTSDFFSYVGLLGCSLKKVYLLLLVLYIFCLEMVFVFCFLTTVGIIILV